MNKTCIKCDKEKTSSDFRKDKRRKDGRTGICKECQRIEDRKYRAKNASIVKAYQLQKKKNIMKHLANI